MKKLIFSLAILIVMVSCNNSKTIDTMASEKSAVPVHVASSSLREYSPSLDLSGTVYADREANLGAALPGRVEKIYFPEGARVKKGDILVSLSGELYASALVEYNTLQKDYDRVSRLIEKGSISQQEYDHVKAMYEASASKVEMMKKNAQIVAPFSGTIVEYLVNEGENYLFNINLDPGYSTTSGVLRLMKLDPVQVEAEVNEKDLHLVKKGGRAEVTLDAFPDTVFAGVISAVKPFLSAMTHTATIRVAVSNHSLMLKPGMFARVSILLDEISTVAVPEDAVLRQQGTDDDYIFIADKGVVSQKKVKTLWNDSGWKGVEGIEDNVTVVTEGKEKLHDGTEITIR